MPYIQQQNRKKFEEAINFIVNNVSADKELAKGELNYIIYSLIKRLLKSWGFKYRNLNDLIGMLECCKLEIYRTLGTEIENAAIFRNGHV